MEEMTEIARLGLLVEAVRYCQRVKAMGMPLEANQLFRYAINRVASRRRLLIFKRCAASASRAADSSAMRLASASFSHVINISRAFWCRTRLETFPPASLTKSSSG
jgi:hypothetical protein